MKKLFTLLFAAAVLAACSDNDHDTPTPTFGIEVSTSETFTYGETRTFAVTLSDAEGIEIVSRPTGWEYEFVEEGLSITAPERSEGVRAGTVKLQAYNGGNISEPVTFDVEAFYIFDFESVPEEYLAVDIYGSNLYDGYANQYTGYTDDATSLTFSIIDFSDYGMAFNFYNGGTAISQWNDMTTDGYTNQCSAYYNDAATGFGGNNGSETFGVVFDASSSMGVKTSVVLGDESETVFDHIWVMNSTYAALSMKDGDSFAKQFSHADQDWFLLTIEGFEADGTSAGTVETYLADFRTSSAAGILTAWKKVDLSSLGAINKVEFKLDSSDVGDWGMNTPAYFCIDDIAIQ